jgi:AmmeMemoRadiSam system protein B
MATIAPVRPFVYAGSWYEGNPRSLARAVDQYLDQAEVPKLPGEVVAVIAPHAGHIFSGPVAGYAFAAVRGATPDMVAVLSPIHRDYYNPILTTAHTAYSTPLGQIPVDEEAVALLEARLKEILGFGLTRVAGDKEHSLEIELPFLQRALAGDFKLLPLMVHKQSLEVLQQLGMALAETLRGKNALLVASTDLSHYKTQKEALFFDTEMLRRVESFSPEQVFLAEEEKKGYACGLGALTAVLWAARELGADTVKVLRHATSGDINGNYDEVVGYGAAVVLRTTSQNKK